MEGGGRFKGGRARAHTRAPLGAQPAGGRAQALPRLQRRPLPKQARIRHNSATPSTAPTHRHPPARPPPALLDPAARHCQTPLTAALPVWLAVLPRLVDGGPAAAVYAPGPEGEHRVGAQHRHDSADHHRDCLAVRVRRDDPVLLCLEGGRVRWGRGGWRRGCCRCVSGGFGGAGCAQRGAVFGHCLVSPLCTAPLHPSTRPAACPSVGGGDGCPC